MNFDLVIHGWDLATATGQDTQIDPGDLDLVERAGSTFGDAIRGPGVCGPAIDVPVDASRQTRVLAFLGRRA